MKYKINLNNKTYEVEVEFAAPMLMQEYRSYAPTQVAPIVAAAPEAAVAAAPSAPSATPAADGGEPVVSPMPGNILKVHVAPGQNVKEGDILVILEAMKMENEIVAPKAGKVSQVLVYAGSRVDTDAPLVVIR